MLEAEVVSGVVCEPHSPKVAGAAQRFLRNLGEGQIPEPLRAVFFDELPRRLVPVPYAGQVVADAGVDAQVGDAPGKNAAKAQHARQLPFEQVGGDHAGDHRDEVRRARVGQGPLSPAVVGTAPRPDAPVGPRLGGRPFHGVVAVLGIVYVGAEEAQFQLAARGVSAAHVLDDDCVAALDEGGGLFDREIALFVVWRSAEKGGEWDRRRLAGIRRNAVPCRRAWSFRGCAGLSMLPFQIRFHASTTHRNPMLPVDESGVLELLAPTRYRLQYDSWQR